MTYNSRHTKVMLRAAALGALCLVFVLELAVGAARAASDVYTVRVNGEAVAMIQNRFQVEEAAEEAVEHLAARAGGSLSDNVTVEYGRSAGLRVLDEEELAELFMKRLTVTSAIRREAAETVAYSTEYVSVPTMLLGDTKVLQEGMDGETVCATITVYENGIEKNTRRVKSTVITEPVTEVIAVGSATYDSTGSYIWPADGRTVNSYFGYRNVSVGNSNHSGLDIGGHTGDPIYAADGGEVVFSGYSGGYGNVVKLCHDDGTVTIYAHCSELLVSEGERVYQGQQIGKIGATGTATGSHLHFEVVVDGKSRDPLDYISAE